MVKTRYGLLLDHDALVDGKALEHLLAAGARNPDAATIAPLFLSPGHGLGGLRLMGPSEKNHQLAEMEPDGDFCTWHFSAAASLFEIEAWRWIGGFDEEIFLYYEDTDLALRINAYGYTEIVTPLARGAS